MSQLRTETDDQNASLSLRFQGTSDLLWYVRKSWIDGSKGWGSGRDLSSLGVRLMLTRTWTIQPANEDFVQLSSGHVAREVSVASVKLKLELYEFVCTQKQCCFFTKPESTFSVTLLKTSTSLRSVAHLSVTLNLSFSRFHLNPTTIKQQQFKLNCV